MGVVYRARHKHSGQLVAIKTLKNITNDAFQRLVREARLMNSISHPNVIRIIEVGLSDDGAPFLVMEQLSGFSAGDWLERRGPFSQQQLLPILIPSIKGLRAIHAANVLHRDLKPSNLFICMRTGELTNVKIIDLGISASSLCQRITKRGEVPGTPAFIAPEVLNGEPFTVRADLYSMALTIYTLLYGENPLNGGSISETVERVRRQRLPPLEDVSDRLNDVLFRAMSVAPEERGTVDDLLCGVRYRGCVSSWPAGNHG